MTEEAPGEAARRDPARIALAAGVGILCAGMALAIAGVVVPGLFIPGVIAIDAGAIALVVAAVLRLRGPGDAAPEPATRRAR